MCYAENVTPKQALIVKKWNIMAKADNIAKFYYSFCVCMWILMPEMHCEKRLWSIENMTVVLLQIVWLTKLVSKFLEETFQKQEHFIESITLTFCHYTTLARSIFLSFSIGDAYCTFRAFRGGITMQQ